MVIQSLSRMVVLRLLALIAASFTSIAVAEFGARVAWKATYNQWLQNQLHGFDYVDPERSLILPTPNTHLTLQQLREQLTIHGKMLGLANLESLVQGLDVPDDEVVFSINSRGFRGPEFTVPKPETSFRVLAIGDSCTWGPALDEGPLVREERQAETQADDDERASGREGEEQGRGMAISKGAGASHGGAPSARLRRSTHRRTTTTPPTAVAAAEPAIPSGPSIGRSGGSPGTTGIAAR